MENARIVENVVLPSKGLIYEEDVSPEIELSSMKTKHEMLRLSATEESQKVMAEIIDDCIVGDLGISSYDLCLGDFQYLLYNLRVVTFGPDYEMTAKCPFCGYENTVKVNLDELPVNEFDESLADLLEFTLPVSGNKIKLTMQTPRMLDRINSKMRQYNKRRKNTNENTVVLFTIMSSIEEIDDEAPDTLHLEDWVRELPMADTNTILKRIDEINGKLGIELDTLEVCGVCGSNYIAPFRINNTFFRPDITIS